MLGHELAIKQGKVSCFQTRNQPRQSHFGCIAGTREHAFSAKCTANRQTIEAANQILLSVCVNPLPAFDAVSKAKLMEPIERLLDFCINPCFPAIR